MSKRSFDIIMYNNAAEIGIGCMYHSHRLLFCRGIAKAMEGIERLLVVIQYRTLPDADLTIIKNQEKHQLNRVVLIN